MGPDSCTIINKKSHYVAALLCPLGKQKNNCNGICSIYNLFLYYAVLGIPSEMSGGNFSRSQSLVDIRSIRATTDDATEEGQVAFHSYFSEAEGLELLTQDSPGDPSADSNLGAIANVSSLLDYESDSPEPDPEARTTTERKSPPHAAMDIEHTCTASVTNVMDPVYYQCRSARTLCQKDTLVSVTVDESFGKRVVVQTPGVGSLEDHDGICNTFHGSRVTKGNCIVNESISSSFDPSKLVCVSCSNEHPVINNQPSVFLFSDQNFVPFITSKTKNCINVVRVENASLHELFEIAREIIGNVALPEGSIFMFGSVSYLSRLGTSMYAKDWTEITAMTLEQWHGSRVCPLIPLILKECAGSVTRELNELSLWLEDVYDSDPQGLHEVWRGLVAAMDSLSSGAMQLDVMDSYKVLLPGSLQCSTLNKPLTFCSSSSRPVTFLGLPKDRCDELLSLLLNNIFTNFRACSRPEDDLVRADEIAKGSETAEQKVILIGASNLSRACGSFEALDLCFENHTVQGWTPTAENIKKW
jgi:hypothetical protein